MLPSTWVLAGRCLTLVGDKTWQLHQDPVELHQEFLLIQKKVLHGDSILVSRCIRSKPSQVGMMLESRACPAPIRRTSGLTDHHLGYTEATKGRRKISRRAKSRESGDDHSFAEP